MHKSNALPSYAKAAPLTKKILGTIVDLSRLRRGFKIFLTEHRIRNLFHCLTNGLVGFKGKRDGQMPGLQTGHNAWFQALLSARRS